MATPIEHVSWWPALLTKFNHNWMQRILTRKIASFFGHGNVLVVFPIHPITKHRKKVMQFGISRINNRYQYSVTTFWWSSSVSTSIEALIGNVISLSFAVMLINISLLRTVEASIVIMKTPPINTLMQNNICDLLLSWPKALCDNNVGLVHYSMLTLIAAVLTSKGLNCAFTSLIINNVYNRMSMCTPTHALQS